MHWTATDVPLKTDMRSVHSTPILFWFLNLRALENCPAPFMRMKKLRSMIAAATSVGPKRELFS